MLPYPQILLFVSCWVLFVLAHQVLMYFNLYWFVWWSDIVMHSLGGFLLVWSWYAVKNFGAFPAFFNLRFARPLVFLWIMMIGWEVFELMFGLTGAHTYLGDTLLDFAVGFGGGLLAFHLFSSRTIQS